MVLTASQGQQFVASNIIDSTLTSAAIMASFLPLLTASARKIYAAGSSTRTGFLALTALKRLFKLGFNDETVSHRVT